MPVAVAHCSEMNDDVRETLSDFFPVWECFVLFNKLSEGGGCNCGKFETVGENMHTNGHRPSVPNFSRDSRACVFCISWSAQYLTQILFYFLPLCIMGVCLAKSSPVSSYYRIRRVYAGGGLGHPTLPLNFFSLPSYFFTIVEQTHYPF